MNTQQRQAPNAQRRRRKWLAGMGIGIFIAVSAAVCFWVGKPMLNLLNDPSQFRAWVQKQGWWGGVAFVGMMALQLVVAAIPGEPLEIAAGYAFGAAKGTLLCLLGAVIGGAIVFGFVRRYGSRAVEVFFPREKIDSLRIFRDERRLEAGLFVIFLFPGTPKDLLTYCVGLSHMRLGRWLLISGMGRIPSVITSTIGGDALSMGHYGFAAAVFGVTLALCGLGILVYRRINGAGKKGSGSDGKAADRG